MTEESLATFFANCGTVMDCRICGDPNSAMRFAFIEFMEESGAQEVGGDGKVQLLSCDMQHVASFLVSHGQHGRAPVDRGCCMCAHRLAPAHLLQRASQPSNSDVHRQSYTCSCLDSQT